MKIKELVNTKEKVISPFTSIASIETDLISNMYLVVKENGAFLGLLTPSDVLASGHNLVIDCYTQKPSIDGNEEAETVMNLMLRNGISVAPVFEDSNKYIGSILLNTMLQRVWDITKQNVTINWVNVIEDEEKEEDKQRFSAELFHNTRNPVQVIMSAVDMLRTPDDNFDRKLLLSSIESNAKLLDSLITRLYSYYFSADN
jgi:CBS domain-containing protein